MATVSETQQMREFKNFSKNLKTTSTGVKFGKKLFTDPNSLSPKMIIDALRILGLNVPREAVIGADIAQMIVSGQAAIRAYQDGKKLNEISSPGLASLSAGVRVMSDLGWINDKDNNIARSFQLGSDVGALIGSCGTDWRAWTSLAMSGYITNLENKGRAEMLANTAVFNGVNQYLSKEQKAYGDNLADFTSGKIGVLGWITKNILAAPTLVAQNIKGNQALIAKVPFLAQLDSLPVYDVTFSASSTVSDTLLGLGSFNQQSATANFTLKSLGNFDNLDQVRHFIYYKLIEPHIYGYQYANNYFSGRSLSIETMSVFYALGLGSGYVSESEDYSKYFQSLGLTPNETEDGFIDNFIDINQKPVPTFKDSMISFYGEKTFAPSMSSPFDQNKQNILTANKLGDIDFLMKFKEVRDRFSQFCKFPLIPDQFVMALDRGGQRFQVQEKWQGWRHIQNFSVALQYLDMVRKDPVYFDFETEEIKKYSFMKNLDVYTAKVEYLFNLSLIRKINKNAKGNVAYFFGTSPDKIIKVNENQEGAGVFKTM